MLFIQSGHDLTLSYSANGNMATNNAHHRIVAALLPVRLRLNGISIELCKCVAALIAFVCFIFFGGAIRCATHFIFTFGAVHCSC